MMKKWKQKIMKMKKKKIKIQNDKINNSTKNTTPPSTPIIEPITKKDNTENDKEISKPIVDDTVVSKPIVDDTVVSQKILPIVIPKPTVNSVIQIEKNDEIPSIVIPMLPTIDEIPTNILQPIDNKENEKIEEPDGVLFDENSKKFPYFKSLPIGYVLLGEKVQCNNPTTIPVLRGNLIKQNNPVYNQNKYFINDKILAPKRIYDIKTKSCIDTTDDELLQHLINPIVNASYNEGLPSIKYNLKTKQIDYADEIKSLKLENDIIDQMLTLNNNVLNTEINKYNEFKRFLTTGVNLKIFTGKIIQYYCYNYQYREPILKVIQPSIGYAPFSKLCFDISQYKYKTDIVDFAKEKKVIGDVDGVPYIIAYKNKIKILDKFKDLMNNFDPSNIESITSSANKLDKLSIQVNGENIDVNNLTDLHYNAYTNTMTTCNEAHAERVLDKLPYKTSYIFQHKITKIEMFNKNKKLFELKNPNKKSTKEKIKIYANTVIHMGVWTEYGLIEIQCNPKPNTYIESYDNKFILKHNTLPSFEDFKIDSNTPLHYTAVTPLTDNEYKYEHIPLFMQNIKNININYPAAAKGVDHKKLFCVYHDEYYENYKNS